MADKKYPNVDKSDFVYLSKRKTPINTQERARFAVGSAKKHEGKNSKIHKKARRKVNNRHPILMDKTKR